MTQTTEERPGGSGFRVNRKSEPAPAVMHHMRYILVYETMNVYGGIQSIIIRLSNFIAKAGGSIIVVTRENLLQDQFHKNVSVIVDNDLSINNIIRSLSPTGEHGFKIVTFAPASLALGNALARTLARKVNAHVSLIHGVFHPRDFFRENEKIHCHYLNFGLAHSVGLERIFYMNAPCRDSHEAFFKKDLRNSNILSVPIDERARTWMPRDDNNLRICSVGRIVPFKAYNFSAPAISVALRDKQHAATWDIYGHGSHEYLLEEVIKKHPNCGVSFRGALNLLDFDETVVKYDLFIGMGTAALQAAQLGVPTICAIDNQEDLAYGFIYDAPSGCVGENVTGMQARSISETILQYAVASRDQRTDISAKCHAITAQYSIESFFEGLQKITTAVQPRHFDLSEIYSRFYLWAIKKNFIWRFCRRFRGMSTL